MKTNFYKIFVFLSVALGFSTAWGQVTETFTSNGTFVVPAGVTSITVECWGGGGGGGRSTSFNAGRGGGGGGAYARSILTVSPMDNFAVVIGQGGTGGNLTAAANTGGSTTFGGTTVVAVGGGGVANNTNTAGAGGLAASCTYNDIAYNGGNGVNGSGSTAGAGGGGAGSSGAGGNGSGMTAGAGAADNGGNGGAGRNTAGAGNPGQNYGGGGGGGQRFLSNVNGGAGAPGLVRVTYTLPPCSGTPNAGTATISSALGCAPASFTLDATGVSMGPGIEYQWQYSSTGSAPWTDLAGGTTVAFATSSSTDMYYRLRTYCSNSAEENFSSTISFTVAQCLCTYPAVYASNNADTEISNVTVGTINNTSTCAAVAPGAGSILRRYGNYAGHVAPTSHMLGTTVSFSLTQTSCGGDYGNGFQLYVDWNQDGDFLDAGEMVYNQPTAATGTHTKSGTFTVPMDAVLGTTRMRVVVVEIGFPTATNYAHTGYTYGETEDYCFTVLALPTCSGTPDAGTATISSASGCPSTNFTLDATGITIGDGIEYQWQYSPTGGAPWTDLTGATTASFVTNTASTMHYRLRTYCSASDEENFSSSISYTINYTPCQCDSYAIVGPSSAADTEISSVTVGTMTNNVNTCSTAAPGPGSLAGQYSNFTTTVSGPSEEQGASVSFSVTQATCGTTNYNNIIQIYVDWNQNGTFEDSERMAQSASGLNTSPFAGSFTVPYSASLGSTRMRVVCVEGGTLGTNYATNSYTWGETEDYCFEVLPAPGLQFSSLWVSMDVGSSNWCPGETRNVSVTITNNGTLGWIDGPDDFNVGVKWNGDADYFVRVDALDLAPGDTETYTLTVTAPMTPGTDNLTFDIVKEGCFWFAGNSDGCALNTVGPANTVYTSGTLTINPTPTSPDAGSDATMCVGGSVNLSGTAVAPTISSSTSYTHTSGDGNTQYVAAPTTANNSSCPLDFSVTIPTGAVITGVNISYTMTALGGGWMSEQRSYLECLSTGGAKEGSLAVGVGGFAGTMSYSRTGLSVANAVSGGGTINFRLHGFRTYEGSAGCHATVNKIDNNSVVVTVLYNYQPTLDYSWSPATGLSATNIANPVATPGSTQTYTMTASYMGCQSTTSDVTVTVGAASVAPTGVDVVGLPVCHNGDITLSPIGGSLATGSNWEYFAGSCASGVIGTGASTTVTPSGSTDYFVRASAGTGCPPSSCASVSVTMPSQGTSLAVDGQNATCKVDDGSWVHFYNSSGNLLASINSNGQDLGEVLVTAHVADDPYISVACDDQTNASFFQANLQRTYVITPEFQPINPVQVRLYMLNSEIDAYIAAAASTVQNLDDDITGLADMNMSKVSSGVLGGDPTNICSAGGTVVYVEKDAYGNINDLAAFNGFTATSYLEFTIDGFSEFFPMKTEDSPLPVTLTNFAANCMGEKVNVNWRTASELNASHYVLQSSRDGQTWMHLAQINAVGTTNQASNYSYDDQNFGAVTYYRLVQVDLNGTQQIYGPISANCALESNIMTVYPNPTNDNFAVYIQTSENYASAVIELVDMSGRVLSSQTTDLNSGSTMLNFEGKELHSGTYMIRVKGQNDKFTPIRVVKM